MGFISYGRQDNKLIKLSDSDKSLKKTAVSGVEGGWSRQCGQRRCSLGRDLGEVEPARQRYGGGEHSVLY